MGPTFQKQEVGWGPCDLPILIPLLLLAKLLPDSPTPAPSCGGTGTHLISLDCPGIVPTLSPWPLLDQDTGPAWKKPIKLFCLLGAESGRGGRLGGGEWRAHGHPVSYPGSDATGPDTGDSAISGPSSFPDSAVQPGRRCR